MLKGENSLEYQIQQLVDMEEIRGLALRYCIVVWNADFEGYIELFVPEGRMVSPSKFLLSTASGRDELKAFWEKGIGFNPQPLLHNHFVTLTGPDTAKGTCHKEIRMTINGERYLILSQYDDIYVKVDGAWKFKERSFVPKSQRKVADETSAK